MPELVRAGIALPVILGLAFLLLLVHELGHYLAARACQRPVRLLAVGFGPRLLERTDQHGTTWRLALLPLGGYVALRPEPAGGARFRAQPVLLRLAIIAAGPMANVVLAAALYAGLAAAVGASSFRTVANSIEPGSPAEHAGLQPGDQIVAANGIDTSHLEDLRPILERLPGQRVTFTVDRHGQRLELAAVLAARREHGHIIGHLGISSSDIVTRPIGPAEALELGIERAWRGAADTMTGLVQALSTGNMPNSFATAVDVAELKGPDAQAGLPALVALMALLSIGLALTNLLPIPVLDGGALLIGLAELVRRRPALPAMLAAPTAPAQLGSRP